MKAFTAIFVTLSVSLTAFAVNRPAVVLEGSATYVGVLNADGLHSIAIVGKVLSSNIAELSPGSAANTEAVLDYSMGVELCKRAVFVVTPAIVVQGAETKAHARYAYCLENI